MTDHDPGMVWLTVAEGQLDLPGQTVGVYQVQSPVTGDYLQTEDLHAAMDTAVRIATEHKLLVAVVPGSVSAPGQAKAARLVSITGDTLVLDPDEVWAYDWAGDGRRLILD